MRRAVRLAALRSTMLAMALAGCTYRLHDAADARGLPVISADLWKSMLYVARVDTPAATAPRPIVIDLGWQHADARLQQALRALGADTSHVAAVFMTHSHQDHIGALPETRTPRWPPPLPLRRHTSSWRLLAGAPFYLTSQEVYRFEGERRHRGPVPFLADIFLWSEFDRPAPYELAMRGFERDTCFTLGHDTLRAFTIPGHTTVSAAYLFRGVLFAGDALTYGTPSFLIPMPHNAPFGWGKFRPGSHAFADNYEQNVDSLASLREKVRPFHPRVVCIAHAMCTAHTDDFWRDVLGARRSKTPLAMPPQPGGCGSVEAVAPTEREPSRAPLSAPARRRGQGGSGSPPNLSGIRSSMNSAGLTGAIPMTTFNRP